MNGPTSVPNIVGLRVGYMGVFALQIALQICRPHKLACAHVAMGIESSARGMQEYHEARAAGASG